MTVALPDDPVALQALDLVARHEQQPIANHSIRTYLHAQRIARARDIADVPTDLLFFACVLHDIGTADAYDGSSRFEIDGADAAAAFLTERGLDADRVDQVWEAIALHTSPQIAERRGPVTMLTRLGVLADFGISEPADRAAVETDYPRLDFERVLRQTVVEQALRTPAKAPPSSWPGDLLRAHQAGTHRTP